MDKVTLDQILKDFANQVAKSLAESNARTDELMAKFDARMKKLEEAQAKSNAEADARMKKLEETQAKTSRELDKVGKYLDKVGEKVDKLGENYGGLGHNLGRETEEKIFSFLQKDKKIGNILFHYILMNLKTPNFELDALLVNTEWAGILEVKRNLTVHDIKKYFTETLPKFDEYFSESDFVKKKKLYLFGCETIAPNAMEMLKEKGCFLIQPKYKSFTITEIKKSSSTLSK